MRGKSLDDWDNLTAKLMRVTFAHTNVGISPWPQHILHASWLENFSIMETRILDPRQRPAGAKDVVWKGISNVSKGQPHQVAQER